MGGLIFTAVLLLLVREGTADTAGTAVEPLGQSLSKALQDPAAIRHIREIKKKQNLRKKKKASKTGSKKKFSNRRKDNRIRNKNKNKYKNKNKIKKNATGRKLKKKVDKSKRKKTRGKKRKGNNNSKRRIRKKISRKKERGKKKSSNKKSKKNNNRKRKTVKNIRSSCKDVSCLNNLLQVLKVDKDTVQNFMQQKKRIDKKLSLAGNKKGKSNVTASAKSSLESSLGGREIRDLFHI